MVVNPSHVVFAVFLLVLFFAFISVGLGIVPALLFAAAAGIALLLICGEIADGVKALMGKN